MPRARGGGKMRRMLRAATPDDRPALIALLRAEDRAWADDDGVSDEELGDVIDRFPEALVRVDGSAQILGMAAVSDAGGTLLVLDPEADPAPLLPELVDWIEARGGAHELHGYAADVRRLAWFEAHGFPYTRSLYDLVRDTTAPLDPPSWPVSVVVSRYVPNDEEDAAVHDLIYREAAWAEVPGHTDRSLESWRAIQSPEHRSFVARRGEQPIGWISGIAYPDGRGWINQIAVARSARGTGLGRALLLHAGADLLTHGATTLALGVSAANTTALRLYESTGFSIEREWRYHGPSAFGGLHNAD
jgi:ribosomal protein S18 acetylase RimI-like enzyme